MPDDLIKPVPPLELIPTLPPTTTHEEDLTIRTKRHVSLIWEYTQALIALVVVGATVWAGLHVQAGKDVPTILSTLSGMVVGSYFQKKMASALGKKANSS